MLAGIVKRSGSVATLCMTHPTLWSSLLVTGLVVGVRAMGGWQPMELLTFDALVQLRTHLDPEPRLLIVAVTDEDIRRQQRWPLPDAVIAQALQNLQQQHPVVIGLDIYRDLPYPPGTSTLAAQLQARNVVSITSMGDGDGQVPPPPGVPADQVGFSDFLVDTDAVIRRSLLFARSQKDRMYAFALRLSLAYLDAGSVQGKAYPLQVQQNGLRIGAVEFPVLNPQSGGYQGLDDRGYQMLLDYRTDLARVHQVTLEQVLQNQVDPTWVNGKIVLIGTTAASAKDLFLTPLNKMQQQSPATPGIMVHAEITSQILGTVLDGRPTLWDWSEAEEILWIGAWAVLGGSIAWRCRHPLRLAGVTGVAGMGLTVTSVWLFGLGGWVPFGPAAIALVATTASLIVYRLLHDTFHDPLTQLPNRTMFLRYVHRALMLRQLPPLLPGPRTGAATGSAAGAPATSAPETGGLAVLSIGLDGFKTINDSLGHDLGDQLLREMTRRLKLCLGAGDRLARVGGDEFAILWQLPPPLPEMPAATGMETTVFELADCLRNQWHLPFHLDNHEVFISASVGIALHDGKRDYPAKDLLRDAHTAMHQAKASGKSGHQLFVAGMRQRGVTRLQLETDLHYALERQEFCLYYQPIVALSTGRIVGFEALVRWQHPRRGLVFPGDFIPIAEATDLIIPLGHWAIQTACQQVCQWQRTCPQEPPLGISVNLSGKQFSQPDLVEEVEAILQQTQLPPQCLKLEITESVAMTDAESAIALLNRLRGLNLQLSIDDFGTGYSSLSYLHRFPTSTIKVDRSFVGRMGAGNEDNQIVQTIIMLGHNLGMDIVAEGIETPEQLALLRGLNCDYGQGYLFAKPLPAQAVPPFLQTQPQW